MPSRPGPTLSDEIDLESPYGQLLTIYGSVPNGTRGKIVSPLGDELKVKFPQLQEAVHVPSHWAKTVLKVAHG